MASTYDSGSIWKRNAQDYSRFMGSLAQPGRTLTKAEREERKKQKQAAAARQDSAVAGLDGTPDSQSPAIAWIHQLLAYIRQRTLSWIGRTLDDEQFPLCASAIVDYQAFETPRQQWQRLENRTARFRFQHLTPTVIFFVLVFGALYFCTNFILSLFSFVTACNVTASTVFVPVTETVTTTISVPGIFSSASSAASDVSAITQSSGSPTTTYTSTSVYTLTTTVVPIITSATVISSSSGSGYYYYATNGTTSWLGASPTGTGQFTTATVPIMIQPVPSISQSTTTLYSTATETITFIPPAYTSTTFSMVGPASTTTSYITAYKTVQVSAVTTVSMSHSSFAGVASSGWNASSIAGAGQATATGISHTGVATTITQIYMYGAGSSTLSTSTNVITTTIEIPQTVTYSVQSVPVASTNATGMTSSMNVTYTESPVTVTYSFEEATPSTTVLSHNQGFTYAGATSSNFPSMHPGSSGILPNSSLVGTVNAMTTSAVVHIHSTSMVNSSPGSPSSAGSSSLVGAVSGTTSATSPQYNASPFASGLSSSPATSSSAVGAITGSAASVTTGEHNATATVTATASTTSDSSSTPTAMTMSVTENVTNATTAVIASTSSHEQTLLSSVSTAASATSSGTSTTDLPYNYGQTPSSAPSASSSSQNGASQGTSTVGAVNATASQASVFATVTISKGIASSSLLFSHGPVSSTFTAASNGTESSSASSMVSSIMESATMIVTSAGRHTSTGGPSRTLVPMSNTTTTTFEFYSGQSTASTTSASSSTTSSSTMSQSATSASVMSSSATSTLNVTSTASGGPAPISSTCGEYGNFTLNWDDEPNFVPSDGNVTDPSQAPPVFSPYHHLYFAQGYVYAPPPSEPFQPISPPHLIMFLTNSTGPTSSPDTGSLRPAEIGDGPRGSANALWFNAYSAYLGCDNEGPDSCEMIFTGYTFNESSQSEVSSYHGSATLGPCPGFKNCQLQQVGFPETFQNLSGLQIQAFVGTQQKTWFMDNLTMGWSNNTCAAGLARQSIQ